MKEKNKKWPGMPTSVETMLFYLQEGINNFSEEKAFFAFSKVLSEKEPLTETSGMIIFILDGKYSTGAYFDGHWQEKELQKGDILFIEKARWNKTDIKNMSSIALSIIFYHDYNRIVLSECVNGKIVFNPYYHSNGPVSGTSKNILQSINSLLKSPPLENKSFFSLRGILLKALLLQIENDLMLEEEHLLSKKEYLIRRVATYVQFNYAKPINCGTICAAFNLNPCYLSSLYKEVTGNNLKDDLKQQRLERAKYLLANFDYPINKIAKKCGYENISYFIKNFKERYNVTPKCYQNTKN